MIILIVASTIAGISVTLNHNSIIRITANTPITPQTAKEVYGVTLYPLPFTVQNLTLLYCNCYNGTPYYALTPVNGSALIQIIPNVLSLIITNNQTFPVRVYVADGWDLMDTYYILNSTNSIYITQDYGSNSTQIITAEQQVSFNPYIINYVWGFKIS